MAKRQPMRVISLAASKGGVGKTTLTATLAVRASLDSDRVGIVDFDPQLSLSSWWDRRGGVKNPQLFEDIDSTTEAIELIASEGWEWLFLDTPPSQINRIEPVIACSDFVLIPTRVGIMDIEAIKITEELCHEHQKPYAFILNMVAPGHKMTEAAAQHLRMNRRTVLEPFISYRPSHTAAIYAGRSAAEVRDPTARREIDALWKSVQEFTSRLRRAA